MHLTYHDPCYLGRLNGVVEAPRDLIDRLAGQYSEMVFSGQDSFCCGGGGGGIWMDDDTGRRINEMRIEHALETGAGVIGVACPFCLQMLESGLTSFDRSEVKVYDLAELAAMQLGDYAVDDSGFGDDDQKSRQGGNRA